MANNPKQFYKILPFVVTIIKNDDDKILVGKHPNLKHKPYPEFWDLPGGKLEENESVEEAVIREVKEETGFDVTKIQLQSVFHHSNNEILPEASPITIPALALIYEIEVSGEFAPTELEDMHWAKIEEIKKLKTTPWLKYLLNLLEN